MDMPKVMLRFSCGSEEGVLLPREPVLGDTIELRKEEYIVSKVLLGEKGKFIAIIHDNLQSPKPSRSTAL